MAGIEEAFKNFVNRVSQKEQREDKSAERGFQYGGGAIGYANGGYPPVEQDSIYLPQSEFGDQQTGEKTIPLIQGMMQGYGYQNTMPNYYMQRPYYNYQNIPNQYEQNQPYYQQGLANGGKVNTHLTTTIPPDRGPNPQGVETLFKRRYS